MSQHRRPRGQHRRPRPAPVARLLLESLETRTLLSGSTTTLPGVMGPLQLLADQTAGAPAPGALYTAAAGYDLFLKIDGIAGESQDKAHRHEIDLESIAWGVANSSTISGGGVGAALPGPTAGQAAFDDFTLTMRTSSATPGLFQASASGQHLKSAVLAVRKAGDNTADFIKWTLSDVLVSAISGDGLTERVTLSFAKIELEYRPQKADGTLDAPVKAGWDLERNVKVAALPGTLPTVDTLTPFAAGVSAYLRVDGIDGESVTRGYERWVPVNAAGWAVANSSTIGGGGGGAGVASFADFRLAIDASKASPLLFLRAASGQHINRVTLALVRDGDGPDRQFVTWTLEDVLVSSVQGDGLKEEVTLNFAKIELEYRPIDAAGKVSKPVKAGWDLEHNVKVAALPGTLPTVDTLTPFAAGVSAYLRVDGIDGESTAHGYERWIPVNAAGWAVANSSTTGSGGGGAGVASFADFRLAIDASKASPLLFLRAASGQHINRVTLALVRDGDSPDRQFVTWTLEDVLVSSVQGDGLKEEVTLSFAKIELEYRPQLANGSLDAPVTAGWDLEQNVKVAALPATLPTVDTLTPFAAGVSAYLRVDGIDGESVTRGYERWIPVNAAGWAVANSGISGSGGGGAGVASFADFRLAIDASKASPLLFLRAASGQHIKRVTLALVRDGDGPDRQFVTWTLEDVLVSNIQGDGLSEQLSLNFAKITVEYRPQLANGSLDAPITAGWDLEQNVKVAALPATLPTVDTLTPFAAGVSAYLRVDGIDGEAVTRGYERWIPVNAAGWAVANSSTIGGGGGGAGVASFADFRLALDASKASPLLFLRAASGQHIKRVTLALVRDGGSVANRQFITWTLEDVLVSSIQGNGLSEQLSLNFGKITVEYRPQLVNGSLGTAIKAGWDLKKNVKVGPLPASDSAPAAAPAALPLLDLPAGITAYLAIRGIDGEATARGVEKTIPVRAAGWGVANSGTAVGGGGGGAGKSAFSDFHLTIDASKASPLLWRAVATGEILKEATISYRRTTGSGEVTFLTWTLKEVLVSRHQGDDLSEQISLRFGSVSVAYQAQKMDGTLDRAVTAGWSVTTNTGGGSAGVGTPIKVAVVGGAADSSGFTALVTQLNNDTYYNFTATLVTPVQIDSAAELNAYDVVVVGNNGTAAGDGFATFAPALHAWVEAGGAVVAVGWTAYGAGPGSGAVVRDLEEVLPVAVSSARVGTMNAGYAPAETAHPITDGVAAFTAPWAETPQGLDGGAVALGTFAGVPGVVAGNPGAGRSVYLGAAYAAPASATLALRSGEADRLLEQAIAWAARDTNRAPQAHEDSVTVAPGSEDNTVLVLHNDTDPDGDLLRVFAVTQASHGQVEIAPGNARVLYTPAPGFVGTDSFTYTVRDTVGAESTSVVTVTVAPGVTPPLRVAVVGGAGDNSGFAAVREQLADSSRFRFQLTQVTPAQLDTVEELNAFDVVVLGSNGLGGNDQLELFAAPLRQWVEAGGGVVALGGTVYAAGTVTGSPVLDLDAIVPVGTAGTMTLLSQPEFAPGEISHPISDGIDPFTVPTAEVPPGVDGSGILLGTLNGAAGVVVGSAGAGRAVYLGVLYAAPAAGTAELRSGDADRLLEQAVAWAARDRVPPVVTMTDPDVSGGTMPPDTEHLRIDFSEPVVGGEAASRYLLQGTGGDHLLGTADDEIIPVTPDYAGSTATLTFPPLTEGVYRLTITGLSDAAGNALDGDGDGKADTGYLRDFVVAAAGEPLIAADGFRFDVQPTGGGAGQLLHGSGNAFDGLNRLLVDGLAFAPVGEAILGDGTLTTATQLLAGLQVHRELSVPTSGAVARTVDVFTNPTNADLTVLVRLVGNLGSDAATRLVTTSDGDSEVELTDEWLLTDGGGLALAHYLHGSAGLLPSEVAVIGDNLTWTYALTVSAGATVRLAQFTVVADSAAAAAADADALTDVGGFTASAVAGLSVEERASLVNFRFGQLPATTPIADIVVDEDAAATVIDLWTHFADVRHLPQPLVFTLADNSNPTLFATATISDGRWLTLAPRADVAGAAELTLYATDVAGMTAEAVFTYTLREVNDAPSRTGGVVNDLTVAEDAGIFTLGFGGLSYSIGGGEDEAQQTLTVTFTALPSPSLGNVFLADGVTVVTTGTAYTMTQLRGMRFRATAEANGSAEVRFTVSDDGTTNGAADPQSVIEALIVTVTPVNDTPLRTAGVTATLVVQPNTAERAVGLTTLNYSPGGGADEAGQTLSYRITGLPPASIGTVRLADGTAVLAGALYSLSELRGLRFLPGSSHGSGELTFTVSDDGQPNPQSRTEIVTIAVVPAADPEPNDTPGTALAASGTNQGYLGNTLDGAQDVDWYALSLTAGQEVTLSAPYQLGLQFYNPSGTDITSQLRYQKDYFVRQGGTYFVRLSGGGSWTGAYSFSYHTVTPTVDYPEGAAGNDSVATAAAVAVTPGTPVNVRGYLGDGPEPAGYDRDLYAVSLAAGQQLRIEYTGGEVGSWYGNTYVRDAAGNVLTQKTELSLRPVDFVAFEARTVYVEYSVGGGLLYPYQLTFSISTLDPATLDPEPNDSLATATPATAGTPTPGYLGNGAAGVNDVDWYALSLTAGQEVTLSAPYQLGLQFYNPSGTDITSQLRYQKDYFVRQGGTYFVRLSGGGSWTGAYSFSYHTVTPTVDYPEGAVGNDSVATAAPVAVTPGTPVNVRGYLGDGPEPAGYDRDLYAVSLAAGQQLRIEYTGGEVGSWYGNTYVRDAAGNVLTQKTELSLRPVDFVAFEARTVYVEYSVGGGLLYPYQLTFSISTLDPATLDPEPNDTLATATPATAGTPTPGYLGNGAAGVNDVDWYALSLTAGQEVTLSAPYQLGLQFYNPAGTDITSQLRYQKDYFVRQGGTHFVRLSGGGSWTGAYSFSYHTVTPTVDYPEGAVGNDSVATAAPVAVTPGTPVNVRGYLGDGPEPAGYDRDLHAVNLAAGQQLRIEYTGGEVGSWYGNTYVRDAAGNVLTQKTELSLRPVDFVAFEARTVYVEYSVGGGLLYPYQLTLTVTNNPNAPIVSPISDRNIAEDGDTGAIAFTVDDPQTGPDSVLVTAVSQDPTLVPNGGIVVAGSGANRTVTVTPAANQTGTATIVLTVSDGSTTIFETFTVTVTPVNDAPTAQDLTVQVNEDISQSITLAGSDVDGDALTYLLVSGPAHGTLLGSGASRSYTPDGDFFGTDGFTYRVFDGSLDSAVVTVTLNVAAVNDLPWIVSPPLFSTAEETAVAGTLAASDVEGDAVSFALHTAPQHGTVEVQADGSFVYTPDADFTGIDSFTVLAGDAGGPGAPAAVTIDVTPTDDAPVALAGEAATTEDAAVTVTLTGTDPDGSMPISFVVVGLPLRGRLFDGDSTDGREITAEDVASGYPLVGSQVTYLPDTDYHGSDGFSFLASDGVLTSVEPAPVSFTVTPVNDAPVASAVEVVLDEDTAIEAGVPAEDAEGDPLTFELISGPINGELAFRADGGFVYTPARDYNGPDSFTVLVRDDTAEGNEVTVTLLVQAVDDTPQSEGDAYKVNRNGTLTVVAGSGVLANDSDVEGAALTATLVKAPTRGSLTLSADGAFVYRPARGFVGRDSFTYRADDGSGTGVPTLVSLYVIDTDIQVLSAVATPRATIEVTYDIAAGTSTPTGFDLGFYRSADGFFGRDLPLGGILRVSDPADLTPGLHTRTFTIGSGPGQVRLPGLGAAEVVADYHLLVVADPKNAILEEDGRLVFLDNTTVLTGAHVDAAGILHVHGGSGGDGIRLATLPDGSTELELNGQSIVYAPSLITAVRVRSHGGDDRVDGSALAVPLTVFGGDGRDTLIGGDGDDRLDGGSGEDRLSGGGGSNLLLGGLGLDRVVESAGGTALLTSSRLTFGGTQTLVAVEQAELSGASGAAFDVSGWFGAASLSVADGTGTVIVNRNAHFTLTDSRLIVSSGGLFELAGIATATLRGGTAANRFTVGGWSGGGSLSGGGGGDSVLASKDSDFTLADGLLRSGDGMALSLTAVRTAYLTGGASDTRFDVGGWTGAGILSGGGGSDSVSASRNANFVLSNLALTVSGGAPVSLRDIERAELTGGVGNNLFTVSGWTGGGSLNGGGGNDTLVAVKNQQFTLSDAGLSSSDGMALTLVTDSGIRSAQLTGGAGANTFDVSGWTGGGVLNGSLGSDTVRAVRDADFTLTNGVLSADDGMALTLIAVRTAHLGGGSGDSVFDVSGWTGRGSLAGGGGSDVVVLHRNAHLTLSDAALTASDGMNLALADIARARLVGGSSNNLLDARDFSGQAVLDGTGGNDTLLGGSGRDLLIGGIGTDTLAGGGGDDLLSGGMTAYDENLAALLAVLDEWGRVDRDYGERVAALTAGVGADGAIRLVAATVLNDRQRDQLTGGADLDWLFLAPDDGGDADEDETTTEPG